jgi:hypothetical protein
MGHQPPSSQKSIGSFSVVYQHVAAFRISGFLGTTGCIVEEQAGSSA